MARMVFGTPASTARAHLAPSGRLMNVRAGSLERGALSGERLGRPSAAGLPRGVAAEEDGGGFSTFGGAAGVVPRDSAVPAETVGEVSTTGAGASGWRLEARRAITLAKTTPARNARATINRPRRGPDEAAVLFVEPASFGPGSKRPASRTSISS